MHDGVNEINLERSSKSFKCWRYTFMNSEELDHAPRLWQHSYCAIKIETADNKYGHFLSLLLLPFLLYFITILYLLNLFLCARHETSISEGNYYLEIRQSHLRKADIRISFLHKQFRSYTTETTSCVNDHTDMQKSVSSYHTIHSAQKLHEGDTL